METHALVLGMIYPLKNVNMRRFRTVCIQDVPELEHYKERIRTEESIQRFGCIRRHSWYQEIHPKLDSERERQKRNYLKDS